MQEWLQELTAWHEFYGYTGAAAATLLGLMFVVVSLGRRSLATDRGPRVTRGFFTPIVGFFATIIVVATIMLVPGTAPQVLGALLAAMALSGVICMVATRAHTLWHESELGYDDLLWYVVLPYLSYTAIGAAAASIWMHAFFGLYVVAAAILLLLMIGIRNAWDLVVYSVQQGSPE